MAESIKSILDKMRDAVQNNEYWAPTKWLDEALKLAVLRQDLQSELIKAEIKFRNEIVNLTSKEMSYNKAENMVKGRALLDSEQKENGGLGMTTYEYYNYLRTRDDVVEEILRIAKKRATTPVDL